MIDFIVCIKCTVNVGLMSRNIRRKVNNEMDALFSDLGESTCDFTTELVDGNLLSDTDGKL
jgi:hypothetical protein